MPRLRARAVVGCPVGDLAEVLAHRPGDWLKPFARIASHEGEQVGTRLRASLGSAPRGSISVSKAVVVRLGEPERTDGAGAAVVSVPVRWEAAGYRWLFPVFEGFFVLREVSPGCTEVTIEGSYDPPGGLVGDLADRTVARKAARASVRNLLANLGAAAEELFRSPEPHKDMGNLP